MTNPTPTLQALARNMIERLGIVDAEYPVDQMVDEAMMFARQVQALQREADASLVQEMEAKLAYAHQQLRGYRAAATVPDLTVYPRRLTQILEAHGWQHEGLFWQHPAFPGETYDDRAAIEASLRRSSAPGTERDGASRDVSRT